MQTKPDFTEFEYPSSRQFTFDIGRIGVDKHTVQALLEVDVTEAWQKLRESRASGQKISFFIWLLKLSADCAAAHPVVTGTNRMRRNRVTVFKDVDVSIVIEKEVKGVRVPLPYVVRAADKKSMGDIQQELDRVKSQNAQDESDYVLGAKNSRFWFNLYLRLPQGLRVFLMKKFYLENPRQAVRSMGNLMITTVGMAGHTRGWIVPTSVHPVCLAFGSINEQPVVRRGEIARGRILHLTALIDHNVVDGVPAAEFIDDLVQRIERGDLL